MAERMGFEPMVAKGDTRFPGAPDRPLQHLSANVGGEGGIRTHEAYRPPLFESGTISHSVTSPADDNYNIINLATKVIRFNKNKQIFIKFFFFSRGICYV